MSMRNIDTHSKYIQKIILVIVKQNKIENLRTFKLLIESFK
jgi:hypothetical protein